MPGIMRNFRVDPTLWEVAKNKAADDDRSLASVLTAALEAYAAGEPVAVPGLDRKTLLGVVREALQEMSAEGDDDDEDEAEADDDEGEEAAADDVDVDEDTPLTAEGKPTAAIIGHGSLLTDAKSPEIAEAVSTARELLATGAVAVSIGADMDPDSMPDKELLDKLRAEEDWDALEQLLADVPFRIRHVAIEDTAAFADARMVLSEDGSVNGPVTYEGVWTGDMRIFPVGSLVLDDALPISFKLRHDGPVVGVIHSLERVDGTSAARPATVQEDAVAAAAGLGHLAYPAAYMLDPNLTAPTPFTVAAPDRAGLRHAYGHIAPHGVCHRSDMGPCFTYPGDVDAQHKGFHTGAYVQLDDGTAVRVGALTLGGSHINPKLARQGVTAQNVNAHRDDANTIFAMGRVYEDQYGLAFNGVVMPDVTEGQLMRAAASAPSVELWPEGGGRTVVGTHLVPTPAWPVAASMGSAIELAGADSVVVEEAAAFTEDFRSVHESLHRIEQTLALLALDQLTDVPDPD